MSQSTDGENYYYDQSVYNRDKELQKNEQERLYLPIPTVPYSADRYAQILSMTSEELDKLTIEDCVKNEYLLASYALFIKRVLNTEQSRIVFLEHKINSIICQIDTDRYNSWQVRRYQAIKDNAAAQKYQEDLIVAQQKHARLEDLYFGINNISDKLNNIRYMKQRELNNG